MVVTRHLKHEGVWSSHLRPDPSVPEARCVRYNLHADGKTENPMTQAAFLTATSSLIDEHTGPDIPRDVAAELRDTVFSVFRRADQRHRCEQYIHGLLSVEGRKFMRNVATIAEGGATQQSTHHFVGSSTWNWQSMRQLLARFLDAVLVPPVWVVKPTLIIKAGRETVGVDRQYAPDLGRTIHGQQAYGVWFAGPDMAAPVSWRLFLSNSWVLDRPRRLRCDVPPAIRRETLQECAVSAVLEVLSGWDVHQRPVLFDARSVGLQILAPALHAVGVPLLARIESTMRLGLADAALPGYGDELITAGRILQTIARLGHPIEYLDPASGALVRSWVAGIPVLLPRRAVHSAGIRQHAEQMMLFGEWRDPRRAPTEIWLADRPGSTPAELLHTTKLAHRVSRDFAEVGDHVGMRDYAGRSFSGWHRHMTLASVAHAISLFSGAELPGAATTAMRAAG